MESFADIRGWEGVLMKNYSYTMSADEVYTAGWKVPAGYKVLGFVPPAAGNIYLYDCDGGNAKACTIRVANSDFRMPRLVLERNPKIDTEIARLKKRLAELEGV